MAQVNFLTDPQEEKSTLRPADRCSGFWMDRRKTCLCRFDLSFPTCRTRGWGFYCGMGSPDSCFKQTGQI
ncbi:hypothetical protein L195_g051431 [Trifolium pratense]|uniref:Uncharacterized protein n=1 Tax=Trifolium pratense TaxID=57577 RepID=A0A2K3JZI3_TRIPR|nr:hypothetical protein L195_g051431 [Trifolium pratense]